MSAFTAKNRTKNTTGTICCAPGCVNNTHRNRNVSWHTFPKDPDLRKEWIRRVNRQGVRKFSVWQPSYHHRLCGAHFNASGKKLFTEKLPIYFAHKTFESNLPAQNASKIKVTGKQKYAGRLEGSNMQQDTTPECQALFLDPVDLGSEVTVGRETESATILQITNRKNDVSWPSHAFGDHNYVLGGADANICDLLKSKHQLVDTILTRNTLLEEENKKLKEENAALKIKLAVSEKKCKIISSLLKLEKDSPKTPKFCLNSVLKMNSSKIKFYTGFQTSVRLSLFIDFVVRGYCANYGESSGKRSKLDIHEQIFLVLVRLRLGLLETDLAYRFEISESTVSRICTFWLTFLSGYLAQVPMWPDRETVNEYMPEEFKEAYPSTRVILDCTEFYIETPSEFRVQTDTYSTYKSHNTAKGLIGITPNGFVSFVSDLYGGKASDKEITNRSGLYAKLDRGDSVMADRGFLIESELAKVGVALNIPPFLRGEPQLSIADEQLTRNIAKLRIHVERVIHDVKLFRILKYVFPNSMSDKLEEVWKVCCYLNNFINEPLLDRKKKN